MITKTCRVCKQEKPLEELVKHKQCSHGVDALCKECNRNLARKWYYDPNNHHRALEIRRVYQTNNQEEIRKYKQAWQVENREQVYERHKRWRDANREKLRQEQQVWRDTNREKSRTYAKKWRIANPEKLRAHVRNRRAHRRNAPGKHTGADITRQFDYQHGLCYWCSQPLGASYHVDHVVPINRGGSNDSENLVCSCVTCNCAKGDRIPCIEWQPPKPLFPDKNCR